MPLTLLTTRTVMCPTASYDGLLDRGSTSDARLALASVDAMQHLKIAAIPVRIHVIGNRRSTMLDRKRKRVDHRLMHFGNSRRAQSRSLRQRMNPRQEQYFVDINIAEPRDERLIQQQRLDPCLPFSQPRRKLRQPNLERLRPQPLDASVAPLNPSELPRIFVEQHTLVQCEDPVGMRSLDARGEQLPRHAKMHDQFALIESDDNKLAAPCNRFNAPSRTPPSQLLRIARSNKPRSKPRRHNPPPDQVGRERANDGFDFG